jgi:hypothetical protein
VTIAQQILDDLDSVFDAGLTIEIIHIYGQNSETLKAFFDRPYQRALAGDEVETINPSILIRTSQASNIDRDSEFTILGTKYYITEIEADNEGVTRIILSEDQI